jgi:hypothetical protein
LIASTASVVEDAALAWFATLGYAFEDSVPDRGSARFRRAGRGRRWPWSMTSVRPRFARASAAVHEFRILAALRDTLLPRLISGALRVKDAEKVIEVTA